MFRLRPSGARVLCCAPAVMRLVATTEVTISTLG